MWRWVLRNWLSALLGIVALVTLTICLYCLLKCYSHECDDCARYHPVEHAVRHWLISVITDPIKLFTAALTIATVAMWVAMRDTLKQTKRSVDAYVEAERGRMMFERFEWQMSGASYYAVFRNIGRMVATVRGFRVVFGDEVTPYIPGGFEEFILPGKKFIAGADEKARTLAFYPVPARIVEAVRGKQPISVTFNVLYETLSGGFFQLYYASTMEMKDGAYVIDGAIAREYPVSREFASELLFDPSGLEYLQRILREQEEWSAKQGIVSPED